MNTFLSVLRGIVIAPVALVLAVIALPIVIVTGVAKTEVQDHYH